jgi:hypothetical protein
MEGSKLSVKIAHFPDVLAKGYLDKNQFRGAPVQVCGRRWRLRLDLMGNVLQLTQNDLPPKYIDCSLALLPEVNGMTI